MNIFEALRKDHDVQRKIADAIIETHGDTSKRDEIFSDLKTELKAHAVAEERHFYIPLMEHDLTQEKSRHSVAEHHEIDEMIEKLEETDYSSSAWLVEAKKLQHRIHHHLDEEEQEVFQMGGKVLSDKEKTDLASEYDKEMTSQKKKEW
ncbi:hemerythrin domain-containing protein [Cocleimonas sp. KMM 6892]|uniref:hemerythrin domain-containing protein n=1 Tax=unclassified Cocleimonas TaxID=2639732 RepID=UPI002DBDF0B0|nr:MULTISPECIES: hemerythrin domain-containing protein [unclassified Cocleimonas]MEB8431815.1 hemerythrin domain-containing protein [Cocleimonas sp. KMM 6892]MEC4715099.1 hemerythrin domain-containing protein [Cocleimonas sp. KMM 6895]MEC4744087.1 hemerythrin domain-containing protein [Cocleimonas sp. KMM 6896]